VIPHTPKAVTFLAQRLLSHVLPELRTPFGAADVALLGILLEMIGQDFDRAAHARLEDIREMREIFGEARRVGLDDAFVARMDAARALDLSDVRIGQLDEAHARHAAALIELHARVELLGTPEATRLDRLVWQHLERHAERHRYDVSF
jgi:hypothetical protein